MEKRKRTWQFLSDFEECRGLGMLESEEQVKEERFDRALQLRNNKTVKKLEKKLWFINKLHIM